MHELQVWIQPAETTSLKNLQSEEGMKQRAAGASRCSSCSSVMPALELGESRKWILKAFLNSPIDGRMCLGARSGKLRIFKNIYAFAVRLNIAVVEDSRNVTRKSSNFELGSWKPSRSLS